MKILEKDMEDLIASNPLKYLEEPELKLVCRQYSIGSYRFDLLFEDRHGAKLIVEIQRGTLDRNHTYKILDYYDEFKGKHPTDFVELMVVANQIPRERRERLASKGISFREIPESLFLGDLDRDRRKEDDENAEAKRATKEPSKDSDISGFIIETAINNHGTNGIFDKFLSVLKGHEKEIFSRSQIISLVCSCCPGTNSASLIPSDYCYNLVNKGIPFNRHIFEYLENGDYKFLGEGYLYTGRIYWSKRQQPVGEWVNGVLVGNPVNNLGSDHSLLSSIRNQQPEAEYLKHLDSIEKINFVENIDSLLCRESLEIIRIFNKKEITYTCGSKFACIVPQREKIVVGPLLVRFEELNDPKMFCRDIRTKKYSSGGEVRADFARPYLNADYAVFLIRQSLAKVG